MKLLILTQKVDKNDDVLGFFHGWIAEFAKHCEKVTVIALGVGEYDLPRNVKVLSLGKELTSQKSKVHKVESQQKYVTNFYKYIWQERNNYDNVFVHMNPEYVVLGGFLWRLWGKKIGLWYTHKQIDLKLIIAEKLTHTIFSASMESFRLKTKKLNITGHGINTEKYKAEKNTRKGIDILCVGRISEIKNQRLLIESVSTLVNKYNLKNIKVVLVGGAVSSKDKKYLQKIKTLIKENNIESNVIFEGSIPNHKIIKYYQRAKLSVNLCPTGGMDKVVLESMACGTPVMLLNQTFKKIVPDDFLLQNDSSQELSSRIENFLFKKIIFPEDYYNKIERDFSLKKLINKIIFIYQKI